MAFGDHRGLSVGADHPSGQRPGPGAYVVLGVAVAVAEREQLHEFAGQVFVGGLGGIGSARPASAASRRRSASSTPGYGNLPATGCAASGSVRPCARRPGPSARRWQSGCATTGSAFRGPAARRRPCAAATSPTARPAARTAAGCIACGPPVWRLCRAGGGGVKVGIGVATAPGSASGFGAQHGVDVRRPVPGERRVDLGTGHPEPGPPQHAGRADPLRGLPRHALTVRTCS